MNEIFYATIPKNHEGKRDFVKLEETSYELAETFLVAYTQKTHGIELSNCELLEANEYERDYVYTCSKGCGLGHNIVIRNESAVLLAQFHNILSDKDYSEIDKTIEYV